MDRHAVIEQLRSIIEDYLGCENLDLVDIIYRYEGGSLFLRVLVDKPEGGISLDECAFINSRLSKILDEKDYIGQRYMLEVSSPGLDRPLISKNDFLRCSGREVKFFLTEKINGKIELDGIIERVSEDSVFINTKPGAVEIPILKVRKAKQILQ
ncbi:MAG: hypothetical protein A3K83_03225 [Omnitrophica WOR_2 bacterium RBG_13_44_8b]|nr:MAG: hypothetical protein A3K83_03225 [Omnitrophica WOR_2 bacterium RBG_13_44_8b]